MYVAQHSRFTVDGGVVAVDEGEEAFFAEEVADSVAGAETFGLEAEARWRASVLVFNFDVQFGTMFPSASGGICSCT